MQPEPGSLLLQRATDIKSGSHISPSTSPPMDSRRFMTKFCSRASAWFFLTCSAFAFAAVGVPQGRADTTATFTLTAGTLSISAPTGSVSLGSQVASNSSSTISGSLGSVTVADQRGGATSWTTSVISTAFTPPAGPADPASNVSYAAGVITTSATVTATAVAAPNLTGVSTVVTGASTGISSASWNPSITIAVPANFAPGVYSATITHSVA